MEMYSISKLNEKIREKNGIIIQNYEGTALSAYVPKMINGKLFELAFMYSISPNGKGYLTTDRPYAWLAFSPYSGDVIFYNDCGYKDFISTEEYPLNSIVSLKLKAKIGIDEYLKLDEEFIKTYEELRKFVFKDKVLLSNEEKAAIEKYKELFDKIIPPDFLPYYKALSEEFFTWLQK